MPSILEKAINSLDNAQYHLGAVGTEIEELEGIISIKDNEIDMLNQKVRDLQGEIIDLQSENKIQDEIIADYENRLKITNY